MFLPVFLLAFSVAVVDLSTTGALGLGYLATDGAAAAVLGQLLNDTHSLVVNV